MCKKAFSIYFILTQFLSFLPLSYNALRICFLTHLVLYSTLRFIWVTSDSTVSENAGIVPRTSATFALAVGRSNKSSRSHPNSARSHPHSVRPHPLSARSHPHSARSHPHSARSYPHSARSHPHSARSHPRLARSHPRSARSHRCSLANGKICLCSFL